MGRDDDVVFHQVVEEWDAELRSGDPLSYPGYAGRLAALDHEAVRTGRTERYAFVECRYDVLGGSMGAAVGERVVRAYDRATAARLPMLVVTRTGGARLQEGMVALVQLARTADAAARHRESGLLQLAVHAHPSTGGVLISFGAAADVRAAHVGATIGFAGPRVAEAALGVALPEGSHTAERAYQAGWLDAVLAEGEEADWVDAALGVVDRPLPTRPLPAWTDPAARGALLGSLGRGAPSSRGRPADRYRPSRPPVLVVGRARRSRRRRARRLGRDRRTAGRGGRHRPLRA